MSRVAVLKGGRSLERQVSLRSGARVEDALERLGHEVVAIDAGTDLIRRLREAEPDVAFVAMHGRDGEDGTVQELLEILGIPYTGSGVLACVRAMDKVLDQAPAASTPASPRPSSSPSTRPPSATSAPPTPCRAIEERLEFPIVVKPASQGSALGIKFARTAADVPDRPGRRLLLRRQGAARAPHRGPRPGGLDPRRRRRSRSSRPSLRARTSTTSSRATRSAGPPSSAPRTSRGRQLSGAQDLALRTYRLLGCYGFARVDLMLDADGELYVLEANAIPGLTETSLLPQAAEAAGIGFDELVGRMLELAFERVPA